jgi:hypothetical protein
MCKQFNTKRVMRWHFLFKEFGPEIHYTQGKHNIVADALSCLGIDEDKPYKQLSSKDGYKLYAEDPEDFPTGYPLSYAEIAYETVWY